QVSTASTPVTTASLHDNTANLSDATVYAFLANQPKGSQLVHEDLEKIHEDDLEEMDLKWQLALLSMRARRYYQRTGKKITISESDTAGFDKSTMECFNCHKMGHFARECKSPRNQENMLRNQDSSRKTVNIEETSSKAMIAIDGAGFDWSFMAEDEVPTNMAIMAFLDSEVLNEKTCSNTCLKNYETLNTQYDNLRVEFNKFEFDLATYKRGLASVEEQLVFYKKNEVIFYGQIVVLKRDASFKDLEINALNIQLDKLKKEKESNQIKIDNFENASKSLDKLIGSQISDNSKKGVGFESYNVVAPPPTGLFAPPTIDLSNSGLEEFQQPEFEGCGVKVNKSVTENSSNEIKKTSDAPIIEDWVSNCDEDESEIRVVKSDNVQHRPERPSYQQTTLKNRNLNNKVNTVKVISINTAKGNRVKSTVGKQGINVVKSSACKETSPILLIIKIMMEDLLLLQAVLKKMYDKKNNVLFTESEYLILSPKFKLLDESHVMLKFLRKDNMYSFDLKNVVPSKAGKKKVPDQEYILLPLLHTSSYVPSSSKEAEPNDDARKEPTEQPTCVEGDKTDDLVNAASSSFGHQDAFEDTVIFNDAYDDRDEGAKADYNKLETVISVSPIPSTRANKDHPKDQIIGEALDEECWVEAMQEELIQFKLLNVWTLVDLPFGKKAIGTKWVFSNKKDQRGIVVRNKARLMDVKSTFLYGTIEEEIYVSQPLGFVDPEFPDRVYKVEKALYGLHQAPRAWYETLSTYLMENGFRRGTIDKTLFIKKIKNDILLVQVYVDDIIFRSIKKSLSTEFEQLMHKRFQMSSMGELTFFLGLQVEQRKDGIFLSHDKYVYDILKKFGFSSVKTISTPMETHKPLSKDADGTDVDVHLYRSMIGLLMYLTSSRPEIMFAVCACSRFQVQPKASHLHVMKRIFRYLKGLPTLGLWYPKDSPMDLIAYSDSDYAGASLDRKSTTGGCQFLGCRLISWQCKKQTIVANSTTEAEYIAASNCCGQVLWLQNQLLDYGYNFMQTKIHVDNESTICVVKNPVYHLKTKHIEIRHHFIRDSYEKKLIEMVKIHTDYNVADLLTKAFDAARLTFFWLYTTQQMVINSPCLTNKKELTIPGQTTTGQTETGKESSNPLMADSLPKTILQNNNMKRGFTGLHIPLFNTMIVHDQPGQGEGPTLTVESQHTPSASPSTSQPTTSQPTSLQEQPSQAPITEPIPKPTTSSPHLHDTIIPQTPPHMPHDSPLPGGHTPGSVEGSMSLNELTDLCTKLFDKVTNLKKDLKQTKQLYGKAITKLVKKVKLLEDKLKSTTERRKTRMVLSDDEEELNIEDTFKQGRMKEIEIEDVKFTEFTPTKATQGEEQSQDSSDAHLGDLSAAKILVDASRERVKTYTRRKKSTDSSRVSTAAEIFTTAEDVHAKEKFSTDEHIAQKLHDEEKARAAAREEQEKIDFEKALELQRQLDKREDTDDIDWNAIAKQNMAGHKMTYFKGMTYDEIRPIFEEEYKKLQTLFKKDTKVEKTKTKRVAEETLLQESFKKLRADEASRSEPIQEQQTKGSQELSEEELQKLLVIVLVEEMHVEALQVKYPIVNWEVYIEESRLY
ncbi:putative ribonuclease H-like domain-containing protein, partial [Tanacetum coccineum]